MRGLIRCAAVRPAHRPSSRFGVLAVIPGAAVGAASPAKAEPTMQPDALPGASVHRPVKLAVGGALVR